MIYYLASIFQQYFGPLRLFQSTTVLIIVGLFTAFLCTMIFLPRFFPKLPRDRGKEFSVGGAASAGKPTGAGVVFITLYVIVLLLLTPMNNSQLAVLLLTWIVMLTGYLDDKSVTPWGELKKGLLDFVLSLITAFVLYYMREPIFWVPFISKTFTIHPALFISITTVILWISINTTNCTDGVDGLSGTLVLVALISMGTLFYFVQGHREISQYLFRQVIRVKPHHTERNRDHQFPRINTQLFWKRSPFQRRITSNRSILLFRQRGFFLTRLPASRITRTDTIKLEIPIYRFSFLFHEKFHTAIGVHRRTIF